MCTTRLTVARNMQGSFFHQKQFAIDEVFILPNSRWWSKSKSYWKAICNVILHLRRGNVQGKTNMHNNFISLNYNILKNKSVSMAENDKAHPTCASSNSELELARGSLCTSSSSVVSPMSDVMWPGGMQWHPPPDCCQDTSVDKLVSYLQEGRNKAFILVL